MSFSALNRRKSLSRREKKKRKKVFCLLSLLWKKRQFFSGSLKIAFRRVGFRKETRRRLLGWKQRLVFCPSPVMVLILTDREIAFITVDMNSFFFRTEFVYDRRFFYIYIYIFSHHSLWLRAIGHFLSPLLAAHVTLHGFHPFHAREAPVDWVEFSRSENIGQIICTRQERKKGSLYFAADDVRYAKKENIGSGSLGRKYFLFWPLSFFLSFLFVLLSRVYNVTLSLTNEEAMSPND